jgi:uncharacterized protein (DUF433 family)/DNA-binding transcriptional MerR regulator
MAVSVLEREMFSEAEAARLLRLAPSTLHYWLEGGERRGKTYKPVIRPEARGERTVTWAEFIEAGLLRQYRREHHVPMAELRAFIDLLRDRMGVPYPLAHHRPFIADRQLVLEAQGEAGLDPDFCLVAVVNGQLILTAPSQEFVDRVIWSDDIATAWRPAADRRSPVVVDPAMRFGKPSVKGVSTEVLWEYSEAGETSEETAAAFGLSVGEVRWAVAYELTSRAA